MDGEVRRNEVSVLRVLRLVETLAVTTVQDCWWLAAAPCTGKEVR